MLGKSRESKLSCPRCDGELYLKDEILNMLSIIEVYVCKECSRKYISQLRIPKNLSPSFIICRI